MRGDNSLHRSDTTQKNGATRFRVCLTISGLRCASEGSPLERALRKIEGVQDATVNPLRERISLQVDILPRLEGIVHMLEKRGYPVNTGDIRVTTWVGATDVLLAELKREIGCFPNVTYCRTGSPTGRVDFGFMLGTGWENSLRAVCTRLRQAGAN